MAAQDDMNANMPDIEVEDEVTSRISATLDVSQCLLDVEANIDVDADDEATKAEFQEEENFPAYNIAETDPPGKLIRITGMLSLAVND